MNGTRTMTRRSLLTAVGTAGAAAALSGCAAGGSGAAGRTTISFYVTKPEVIQYFGDLADRYNRSQSSVRVVVDSTSNTTADFVRNRPPDLGCWNYNFSVAPFVEHGALWDLSGQPIVRQIKPSLWPLVKQTADYPGRVSAVPYSMTSAGVIYNREIFRQHDLSVPTTWQQLVDVCEKLRSRDVTPFYNTYKDTWTIAQGMFDYSIGGMIDVGAFFTAVEREGAALTPGSRVSFSKDFAEPMARMVQLAGYGNRDAASRSYGDGNLAFAQGRSAMYLQGPWALGEIAKSAKDLDLATFPLPVTDDADRRLVRTNVDLALWIPVASQKKAAALDFMRFLLQPDVHDAYNEAFNGFGVTRDAPPTTNPVLKGLQSFYDEAKFYLGPSQLIPSAIPVANYAQAMAIGASPTAQLRTLDADWARFAIRTS